MAHLAAHQNRDGGCWLVVSLSSVEDNMDIGNIGFIAGNYYIQLDIRHIHPSLSRIFLYKDFTLHMHTLSENTCLQTNGFYMAILS